MKYWAHCRTWSWRRWVEIVRRRTSSSICFWKVIKFKCEHVAANWRVMRTLQWKTKWSPNTRKLSTKYWKSAWCYRLVLLVINPFLMMPFVQVWSREQTRLLLELQANRCAPRENVAVDESNQSKGRVERTCSAPSASNQLDKQMENLCLAMTEKALNNWLKLLLLAPNRNAFYIFANLPSFHVQILCADSAINWS